MHLSGTQSIFRRTPVAPFPRRKKQRKARSKRSILHAMRAMLRVCGKLAGMPVMSICRLRAVLRCESCAARGSICDRGTGDLLRAMTVGCGAAS